MSEFLITVMEVQVADLITVALIGGLIGAMLQTILIFSIANYKIKLRD